MKTKIIATIGPASSDKATLQRMIAAGLDVCRLNFSHGSHEDHLKVISIIHEINRETGGSVAIMADLQGPKIRLGEIADAPVKLAPGDRIIFTTKMITGDAHKVYISYDAFATDVKVGEQILVDDGKLAFKVLSSNHQDEVMLESVNGGLLYPRKGVNLPETRVSLPSLTGKDHQDLEFILQHEIHWLALSFVRSAADIRYLRQRIGEHQGGFKPRIIAKIEKPQAVQHMEEIIRETDAVMIARGDLGVEMPLQTVPMIQKRIIRSCLKAGRPVIVATQMMEGMIDNIRPTRAEVNDVANSVLDGADALMLSGETSVGKYPVETVATMETILSEIEDYEAIYYQQSPPTDAGDIRFISDSVLYNACEMARQTQAEAILVISHSGYSALRLSGHRPRAAVFVFTSSRYVLCQLSLLWGVTAFYDDSVNDPGHYFEMMRTRLLDENLIKPGMLLINVLSSPVWEKGYSNTIKLLTC
ncbi:MAG: pyruvate kinase [Bacteroidales bacterium]|nr:pyruvate kinase [Bacteroidales bacterium]